MKINNVLSYLNGMALDHFEFFIDQAKKTALAPWLQTILFINFSLYNMMTDAKVELKQLVMQLNSPFPNPETQPWHLHIFV